MDEPEGKRKFDIFDDPDEWNMEGTARKTEAEKILDADQRERQKYLDALAYLAGNDDPSDL